jgi:SpoVK/Ycf46/Vps4 family AAA+-type ATPase
MNPEFEEIEKALQAEFGSKEEYCEPEFDKETASAYDFVGLMLANYLKTLDYNSTMAVYSLRDLRGRMTELSPNFCRLFDALKDKQDKHSFVMISEYIKEKEFKQLIDLFNEDVKKRNNGKGFVIYPSIQFLANMLDLNYNETLILQFYYLLGGDMAYDLSCAITELPEHNESLPKFFSKAFNVNISEFEKIVNADDGLFCSGLLEPNNRYKNHFKILHKIQGLIDTNVVLTEKIIEDKLFPNLLDSELDISDFHQKDDIETMVSMINKSIEEKQKGINVLLWGLAGCGKTELPVILAKQEGWRLRVIGDVGNLDTSEKPRNERLLSLNVAQKLFRNSSEKVVLLFDEMEDLFKLDNHALHSKAFINRIIEKTPVPIIWTTNSMHALGAHTIRRMTFNIPFNKVPPASARKNIWLKYKSKYNLDISDEKIESLSRNFDVVPALISNVTKIANLSNLNEDQIARVLKNLDTAMNLGEERVFEEDHKDNSKFRIEFTNTNYDLNKITNKILEVGRKNFNILSYGPSGTGKSTYAIHLAEKLEMRYKIKKASDILSMWVGETEKNIARMFEEAMDSNLFLILDEADSFFQNRGNAVHSWEITQVNEMLVQMEKHKLPFVCTTNIEDRIDPAAFRRFTFKIGYEYLNQKQRYNIYEHYFQKTAPARSLDNFEQLAPGDFANIFEKMDFLGDISDEEIIDMLKEECEIKPTFKRKIGF